MNSLEKVFDSAVTLIPDDPFSSIALLISIAALAHSMSARVEQQLRDRDLLNTQEYNDAYSRSRILTISWLIAYILIVLMALMIAIDPAISDAVLIIAAILIVASALIGLWLLSISAYFFVKYRGISPLIRRAITLRDIYMLAMFVAISLALFLGIDAAFDHESRVLASLTISLLLIALVGLIIVGFSVVLPNNDADNGVQR